MAASCHAKSCGPSATHALQFKTWPASGVVAVGYLGCKALNVGTVLEPVEAFADGVRRGKS